MDFVTGLPQSWSQYDLIWVIMYRIKKSAHFLPVRTTFSVEDYTKLYLQEIMKLHGVPILIKIKSDVAGEKVVVFQIGGDGTL